MRKRRSCCAMSCARLGSPKCASTWTSRVPKFWCSEGRMQPASDEPMFPVAILAGGLATRMRPVTERIPKTLIEVAGRPFVEHQLTLLARERVRKVVLCVGYLGEMIEAVVGDGSRFG